VKTHDHDNPPQANIADGDRPLQRHELLTGRIAYPVQGYTGSGDGIGTDLTAFISDQMRNDWKNNRAVLMVF
jgi:hypothetical protein